MDNELSSEELCDWCSGKARDYYLVLNHANTWDAIYYKRVIGRYCSERCRQEAKEKLLEQGQDRWDKIEEWSTPPSEDDLRVRRPSTGSSSSGAVSSSTEGGSFSVVDCIKGIVGLIAILLIIWLGWSVIKCGWNWIFGGGSEVDVEAEMMKAWQQHLEQRCEAFGDGLSEREVEAKGLRNYSWGEWQEKYRKEREGIQDSEKNESGDNGESYVTQRAREIGNQAKELGDKAKDLWRKVTK